jgi:hypothetical protein
VLLLRLIGLNVLFLVLLLPRAASGFAAPCFGRLSMPAFSPAAPRPQAASVVTHLVDGFQVEKVTTISQNKSHNVWIYDTVYTGYTWSPLTYCTADCTGYTWSPLTYCTTDYTGYTWNPLTCCSGRNPDLRSCTLRVHLFR